MDTVSECVRDSWDYVYQMSAVEFLSVLAYARDRRQEQERVNKVWARRH